MQYLPYRFSAIYLGLMQEEGSIPQERSVLLTLFKYVVCLPLPEVPDVMCPYISALGIRLLFIRVTCPVHLS